MDKRTDELPPISAWEIAARQAIRREDDEISLLADHADHRVLRDHDCLTAKPNPAAFRTEEVIGEDGDWEVSLYSCNTCGRKHLHVFRESDGMPGSGRWYISRVPKTTETGDIRPSDARRVLAGRDRVLVGGRYWGRDAEWSDQPWIYRDLSGLRNGI